MTENNFNDKKEQTMTRMQRREIEAQEEKMKKAREEELERKRAELKATLFDEPKKNVYKKEIPNQKIEKKTQKDVFTRIILSITVLFAFTFLFYMIIDSVTEVNQLYQIINAFLIFLVVICLAAFYKSRKNIVQIIASFLIVVLMGFNGSVMTGILALPKQDTVPSFKGQTLTQAINWADANNIEYEEVMQYSDDVKKYNIIDSNIKENTLTKNIDKIKFTVSNGPDYNKEVIISDMTTWNIDEAVNVIDKNLLNMVTVNYEENLDTEKDIITAQNKSGKMKRNDDLTLTVSLGNTEDLKPIKLKNMKNMTLFKATLYLMRHGIDYELKYEFSDKIDKGNVIKSDIKKGTEVKPFEKVILTISKGKEIKVPKLINMKLSNVTKWMVLNNLNIEYSDKYDDKIKRDHVISATYKEGDIIEEDTTVGIVVSKGKLKMPKFNSLSAFKTWASTYNIKYEVKEEFNNDIKQGDIIKFSVKTGKKIDINKPVIAYVSKGKAIEVPNFNGKTRNQIEKECNSLGINCSFTTKYSTGVDDGKLISQSIKAGEKIAKGDTINFVIATNNKNEVTVNKTNTSNSSNKNYNSRPSSNSSTSNNQSSSGSSSTPTPTPTCKNYTFIAGGAGSNGGETCSIMQNTKNNTNLKINCVYVSSCPNGNTTNGAICSYSHSPGSTVSSCDTITIKIINK